MRNIGFLHGFSKLTGKLKQKRTRDAKLICINISLPGDVRTKLLPDTQYKNARMIKDQDGWNTTARDLGTKWQEDVVTAAK